MNHGSKPETSRLKPVCISVVVPVYAGEKYLDQLVSELRDLREKWIRECAPMTLGEVVLIDDCAVDGSPAIVDRLASENSWVSALHLARNSGQHAATIAGILHTTGEWVATLDEDLQHPPHAITGLLRRAVSNNCDVVYAQPRGAVHQSRFRDLGSRTYKRLMEFLIDNKNARIFNSFRLIRGSVARAAAGVCVHDTYFDVALTWFTERFVTVQADLRDKRYISSGRSSYSLRSLMSHARRLLFSSRMKIIRLGAALGAFVVVASVAAIIITLAVKLIYPEAVRVAGWTSLFMTITFFGGLTTFMLGILLEYMSGLIVRSHGRPLYFIIDRSTDTILEPYFSAAGA